MNSIITFSEREKKRVESFLAENTVSTLPQPKAFADLLFEAADKNDDFYSVLRQWLNYSADYSEIVVNGFSLSTLAEFYVDRRLGILTALRLLWEEKNGLTDICLTIGQSCYADKEMMRYHKTIDLAYLKEGTWYFFGKDYESNSDCELGAFELYRVCENDPVLIELVTSIDDLPQDNLTAQRTGKEDFTLYIGETDLG